MAQASPQEPKSTSLTNLRFIANPSSEFYSIFSQREILDIIQVLESSKEIPLKYAYKGKGAKIWDSFYRKYLLPTWYRTYNVEFWLLNKALKSIAKISSSNHIFKIIDVGAGNSLSVKRFIYSLNKLFTVTQYLACDISEDLLKISQKNITEWFPKIRFKSLQIDIERNQVPNSLTSDEEINIFLHLGVTIGNHRNRIKALQNFRASMGKDDLFIFTNELGDNSKFIGACHHGKQIYEWMQKNLGISPDGCELIRKYDPNIDSIVATMKFIGNQTLDFQCQQKKINKKVEFFANEEITLWRFHKYTISEIKEELEQAGLQLVEYITDRKQSHVMVICSVKQI